MFLLFNLCLTNVWTKSMTSLPVSENIFLLEVISLLLFFPQSWGIWVVEKLDCQFQRAMLLRQSSKNFKIFYFIDVPLWHDWVLARLGKLFDSSQPPVPCHKQLQQHCHLCCQGNICFYCLWISLHFPKALQNIVRILWPIWNNKFLGRNIFI